MGICAPPIDVYGNPWRGGRLPSGGRYGVVNPHDIILRRVLFFGLNVLRGFSLPTDLLSLNEFVRLQGMNGPLSIYKDVQFVYARSIKGDAAFKLLRSSLTESNEVGREPTPQGRTIPRNTASSGRSRPEVLPHTCGAPPGNGFADPHPRRLVRVRTGRCMPFFLL
jgi:hypothetical protein